MKVFILGNGFDLYHYLPTKYINFLNVVIFLKKHYNSETMKTVEDVFSSEDLQKCDEWIRDSVLEHKLVYRQTYLSHEKIIQLIDGVTKNYWFSYFADCFNQDKGWIDFESEIASVVEAFRKLFSGIEPVFSLKNSLQDAKQEYICSKFDFFYGLSNITFTVGGGLDRGKEVLKEYCIEKHYGSKLVKLVNKTKIISELYECLRGFSKLLTLYLDVFVEEPLKTMKKYKMPVENMYNDAGKVISFNYTSTFESLYDFQTKDKFGHIHGMVSEEIVLGINPDKYDEVIDLDTAFIQFKKYYQRVFLKADKTYFDVISDIDRYQGIIDLYIVGHSLDVTDEDVIKEWIENARTVKIFYHEEYAVGEYVEKMISMFGKKQFDDFRKNKRLTFIKHDKIKYI